MSLSERRDEETSSHSMSDNEKGDVAKLKDEPSTDGTQVEKAGSQRASNDAKEEAASPPAAVTDWNGPDDPDNPHNWSMASRVYHSIVPGLFGFAVTFGTSVYTPATADIMQHFDVGRTAALVGLTVYTLGLSFGPVFSAPLSETYGRKIVYMATGPLFMLFTLGAGFSNSLVSLYVCRFFAGLTGSPALAVGGGSNADIVTPQYRAVIASIFLMAPFAGPGIGPVVGGFAAQYKGWRWTQWSMIFVSLGVFLSALPMKETYKPVILKRRAKKLGLTPPKGPEGAMKRTIVVNLFRPVHMLLTESVVFFLSLYTAFAFGVLFLFFAAFPFVFSGPPYFFSNSQVGLTFLAIGFGVLLASITGFIIDRVIYQPQHRKAIAAGKAQAQPEHRLYNAMFGSIGIPLGLFWFGWTADKGVHWAVPVVAAIPFAWGNLLLFTSSALYMVDIYGPLIGASALAANGIFRYTLGSVFPLFTVQMYEKLGIGWATSLLGFLSILMLPIPFVLYKFGPVIRKRSQYPTVV